MADPARSLQGKYQSGNRYPNFGEVITRIEVHGFRGIKNLKIEFPFPVIAFSGLNGAGKSTIAQLAACGYRQTSRSTQSKRYYIKDFFPSSIADPNPFTADASVRFEYESSSMPPKNVTVSRAKREWSGYKRQPKRNCYYVGFSLYIPKIERKDFSIYRSTKLRLDQKRNIPDSVKEKVSEILNEPYKDVHFQGISTKEKEGELAIANRYGAVYSENNMGLGEGRVLFMVDLLETKPERSLFVLEEPETSLHPDAQYRLARYFLDVANRRYHQIIISTHSGILLNALPVEARCLIYRDESGVSNYPNISAVRARAILSGGHEHVKVLVEDDFAKLVLTEIIRLEDSNLLKMVDIVPVGSDSAVKQGMRLLKKLSQTSVAFLDGDSCASPTHLVYKLPGSQPPEVEVFSSTAVQMEIKKLYKIDVAHHTVQRGGVNHHDYPKILAKLASMTIDAFSTESARIYCKQALTDDERGEIYNALRRGLESH